MKQWRRRLYDLPKDPYGTSDQPGWLHQIALTDQAPGQKDFQFSTFIYLPKTIPEEDRLLNLEMFETNAREQLDKRWDDWRGRDSLALFKH